MLNSKSLKLAGWFSIVSAVVTLPMMALSLYSGFMAEENTSISSLEVIFSIAYTILYVYIFLVFRRLLNEKSGFHEVDRYITTLIALNVVLTALCLLMLLFPELEETASIVVLVLMVPMGVVATIFGIKLLNCSDNLFGYLKPFAYLNLATGLMLVSVFLMLFTMLTSIAADVVLAIIFFNSANLMEKEQGV
jgi:hypothetical protein